MHVINISSFSNATEKQNENRSVNIEFSLGKISVVKPSKWSLGVLENIYSKLQLSNTELACYILYCSQSDYYSKPKYSFLEISTLQSSEILNILMQIINLDSEILLIINKNETLENPELAFSKFKIYLENESAKLVTMLMGIFFVVTIGDSWVNTLRGELSNDKSDQFRKMSSLFKVFSDKYGGMLDVNIKKHLSQLLSIVNIKEQFLTAFEQISNNIESIRAAGMWIPSRYSTELGGQLKEPKVSKLSQTELEDLILTYLTSNEENKILTNIITTPLFSERKEIIEQAFKAHALGLYAPAITCLLTQLDYLLVKIEVLLNEKTKARNVNRKVLANIAEFIENKIIYKQSIDSFSSSDGNIGNSIYLFQIKSLAAYLRTIVFEDTDKIKKHKNDINRHGILHGKFMSYPTIGNSKKLILLLDELNTFYIKLPDYLNPREIN